MKNEEEGGLGFWKIAPFLMVPTIITAALQDSLSSNHYTFPYAYARRAFVGMMHRTFRLDYERFGFAVIYICSSFNFLRSPS